MADDQVTDLADRRGDSQSAEISRRMVQLVREYTGRGPTQARTYIRDDVVICVMKDTLTKGERALVDKGEESEVLRLRRTYQSTMADDASAAIEDITGRRVVTFMSDNSTDPDVAAEVFLLEPSSRGEGDVAASS